MTTEQIPTLKEGVVRILRVNGNRLHWNCDFEIGKYEKNVFMDYIDANTPDEIEAAMKAPLTKKKKQGKFIVTTLAVTFQEEQDLVIDDRLPFIYKTIEPVQEETKQEQTAGKSEEANLQSDENVSKLICELQKPIESSIAVAYSDEELAEFKEIVDRKLEAASKELEYLDGKINSADNDMEKEQLIQMKTRQETFIDNLNKALERIADKTYGICRVTGKLIDKDRLRAVPHATLSIEAKLGQNIAAPPEQEPAKKKRTKKDTQVHPFPFLRNYNGYVLYDGGKYDNGMHQVFIFPDCIKVEKDTEPVHIAYYDMIGPGDLNKGIEVAKAWVNQLKRCRVCGCTQYNCKQCIDKTGEPCNWVEEDLCSACKETPAAVPSPAVEKETAPEIQPEAPAQEQSFDHPNFFENLYNLIDGVDVQLNIGRLGSGRMFIRVLPKTINNIKHVELKGTPQDFSEGFFEMIKAPVQTVKGLKADTEQFHKSIVEVKKEQDQSVEKNDKPTTAKKTSNKKAAAKKSTPAKGEKVKPALSKKVSKPVEEKTEETSLF